MDAKQILRRMLDNVAVEQNYDQPQIDIKPITSGGANYTSAIFLATITAPERDALNLFAKVATVGEKMREVVKVDKLFDCEKFVYTELLKTFDKIQDKYGVPEEERFIYPKFYGFDLTRLEEALVLEDLVASGYGSYSRFISVDWAYASEAITALAKWHALAFAYQREDPETFQRLVEERTFPMEDKPNAENMAAFAKICESSIKAVDEKYSEKLQKFMQTFADPENFKRFYSPYKHTVFTHGDYRVSNLMSKTQEDGTISIIPIDYQTIHSGRPACDLVYFIFTGTDQKFRAQHYNRLIDLYYEQLGLALRRLKMDVETVYPRRDFDEELKNTLPFGLSTAIFVLPMILVEAEDAPKLDNNLSDLMVKKNNLYAERMTGIVEDMMEYGVL